MKKAWAWATEHKYLIAAVEGNNATRAGTDTAYNGCTKAGRGSPTDCPLAPGFAQNARVPRLYVARAAHCIGGMARREFGPHKTAQQVIEQARATIAAVEGEN